MQTTNWRRIIATGFAVSALTFSAGINFIAQAQNIGSRDTPASAAIVDNSPSSAAVRDVNGIAAAPEVSFTEPFEDVPGLTARGWFLKNNSNPIGTTTWVQGSTTTFPGQSGGYIAVNYNSTGDVGTISNWLLTPSNTLNNGDQIKFYSRVPANAAGGVSFPDRLQVRLSTAGTSTDVGTTEATVGDFTTLLLDINPTLSTSTTPPNGYPNAWTQFTITLSGLPAAGATGRVAFRYFVTNGGLNGANSNYIGIDSFEYIAAGPTVAFQKRPLDFNGDNKTDYVVARSAGSTAPSFYFIHNGTSIDAKNGQQWGLGVGFTAGDIITPGDYDNDNKTDFAVFRPSATANNSFFYILRSSNNTVQTERFGQAGDDPSVIGDYDGDGRTDVAVYRRGAAGGAPSFFYYRPSGTAGVDFRAQQWGQGNATTVGGDYPAPGDYDGDGKYDFCVQRPATTSPGTAQSTFLLLKSGGGTETIPFSQGNFFTSPGDYDGDGKTDLAGVSTGGANIVFNIRNSSNGAVNAFTFGIGNAVSNTDFIVQGDYNGDGRTDIAIWRSSATVGVPGVFYVLPSGGTGFTAFQWGQSGDYPIAAFNTH